MPSSGSGSTRQRPLCRLRSRLEFRLGRRAALAAWLLPQPSLKETTRETDTRTWGISSPWFRLGTVPPIWWCCCCCCWMHATLLSPPPLLFCDRHQSESSVCHRLWSPFPVSFSLSLLLELELQHHGVCCCSCSCCCCRSSKALRAYWLWCCCCFLWGKGRRRMGWQQQQEARAAAGFRRLFLIQPYRLPVTGTAAAAAATMQQPVCLHPLQLSVHPTRDLPRLLRGAAGL